MYIEFLAHRMTTEIKKDNNKHNAVFIDKKGHYITKYFEPEDTTFDSMVNRMLRFNVHPNGGFSRCIMVSSPNRILRELGGHPTSTVTFCAPMVDPVIEVHMGGREGGRMSDDYLIPDRNQVASDIVAMDANGEVGKNKPSLVKLGLSAVKGQNDQPKLGLIMKPAVDADTNNILNRLLLKLKEMV